MATLRPQTALNTLNGPDGSATYSSNGYTVIAALNGPIEVSRRDEMPEESTLEVNVRPASGVGGPRDRHLELVLHSTLNRIISTETFPRSLIQLTIQILSLPMPVAYDLPKKLSQSSLLTLPALLNASLLSLISGAIPLHTTLSTYLAFTIGGRKDPLIFQAHEKWMIGADVVKHATAIHVISITGEGQLALSESEGDFSFEEWEAACAATKTKSRAAVDEHGMEADGQVSRGRHWLLDLTKQNAELAT